MTWPAPSTPLTGGLFVEIGSGSVKALRTDAGTGEQRLASR